MRRRKKRNLNLLPFFLISSVSIFLAIFIVKFTGIKDQSGDTLGASNSLPPAGIKQTPIPLPTAIIPSNIPRPTVGVIRITPPPVVSIPSTGSTKQPVITPTTSQELQNQLQKWIGSADGININVTMNVNREKIKFSSRLGQTVIKKVVTDGTEQDLNDREKNSVMDLLKQEKIKIANEGPVLVVEKGSDVVLKTHVPITIDPVANTIAIQTSHGVRQSNVVPDKAVSILVAQNVIDHSNDLKHVELHDSIDEAVFFVDGEKKKRLLGLFPVTIKKTVVLSAETGEIYEEEKSFWHGVAEIFSF